MRVKKFSVKKTFVYGCTSVVQHFLCMLKKLGSTSSTAKTNREIDTHYFSPKPQQALLLYSHFTVRQLWASYSRESVLRNELVDGWCHFTHEPLYTVLEQRGMTVKQDVLVLRMVCWEVF